jgi:WD40 repeat protein
LLWEPTTGKPRQRFSLPVPVRALAYAPGGKTLAVGGGDGSVRILDSTSGQEIRRFAAHLVNPQALFGGVHGLAFGANARSLVTWGSDYTLRLWDTDTSRELRRFGGKDLTGAVLSPDGQLLAASVRVPGKPVRLWNVATGAEVRALSCTGAAGQLAFSPDGKTLAATISPNGQAEQPGHVIRWEVASGREIGRLSGHESDIFALAFAPNGSTLATGGCDKTIRIWDLASGKEIRKIGRLGTPIYQLVFTRDGKTLFARVAENRVRLWDPATGKELLGLDAPEWNMAAVAYALTGNLLATASAGTIWVWDATTARKLRKLEGHKSVVTDLGFSANGKLLVSSSQDGSVRLWDAVAGKELRHIQPAPSWTERVAISPDGATIAAGGFQDRPEEIDLWDARSGQVLRRLKVSSEQPGVRPMVYCLAFSPDGRSLIACSGTRLSLLRWEVATGKELTPIGPHDGGLNWAAFSPDGRSVAVASMGRTVYLWETATGRARLILKDRGYTTTLAFSPDGRLLALGNNGSHSLSTGGKVVAEGWEERGQVRLIALADGKLLHTFTGHQGGVDRLAFSPDGKALASGSRDTTALIWDLSAYRRLVVQPGRRLQPAEVEGLWADLRGDAGKAYQAIVMLSAASPGQVVPFLKQRLRPVAIPDAQRVATLLKQLDGDSFSERERAMSELKKLGDGVEPALRTALAGKPPPETRRRLAQLLKDLDVTNPAGERIRTARALEVLERVGDAEARELLRQLAGGKAEAWLTREARASLHRLE